jgi:thymidylate kinase
MKLVLALEGMDGSGKSSLAMYIQNLCDAHGRRCTQIARRGTYATASVAKFTRLLNEEIRDLSPQADLFLRIAREYQRAQLAAAAPSGIVVLDRFVLSILALARLNGLPVDLLTPFLREITLRANLHATIFVKCPFEVAGSRVSGRSPNSSSKRRGKRLLQTLAQHMEADFERGLLTGQQWLVDNSGALEAAEEQVADFLLPYLEKQTTPAPAASPIPG